MHDFTDDDGRWCTSKLDIDRVAKSYFQNFFTSSNPKNLEEVLDVVDIVVTLDMNHTLLQQFTPEEVKMALFSIHPSKSPRPKGMSPFFFQKLWHIVGTDVTNAILSILQSSQLLHKVSYTYIVLIPKINEPKSVFDYRPICLGNVVSRIVSKVLDN